MSTGTLRHHRKGDNTYVFTFSGQTITVNRRFLPGRTALRVRVTSTGRETWTDYRDFPNMHEGDVAFHKQAHQMCARWERMYVHPKKETAVSNDPTPTQSEGGVTMTSAQAAELATRRTGVQHVVGEDGRTLCKAPTAPQGEEQPRVLGTHTFTLRGAQRPSRTGEMARLLKGVTTIMAEYSRQTHLLNTRTPTGDAAADEQVRQNALGFQLRAAYFKSLWDAGFDQDTEWDELVPMVTKLRDMARAALPNSRAALKMRDDKGEQVLNEEARRTVLRAIDAAEMFLMATGGVAQFWEDQDDDKALPTGSEA